MLSSRLWGRGARKGDLVLWPFPRAAARASPGLSPVDLAACWTLLLRWTRHSKSTCQLPHPCFLPGCHRQRQAGNLRVLLKTSLSQKAQGQSVSSLVSSCPWWTSLPPSPDLQHWP